MIETVHILIMLLVWEISQFVRPHQHSSLPISKGRKLNVHDVVEKSYFENLITNSKEMFDFEASFAKEPTSVRDLKDEKRHFVSQGKPRTQPIRVKKAVRHPCFKSSSPTNIPGLTLVRVKCLERTPFGCENNESPELLGVCRTLRCRDGNRLIPYSCVCASLKYKINIRLNCSEIPVSI